MAWTTTGDVAEFLDATGEFLRSRPVEHTLQLSIVAAIGRLGRFAFGEEPPVLGWWDEGGGPVGVATLTPPHPLAIGPVPDRAAEELADVLAARVPELTGVGARVGTAECFARRWKERTGADATVRMRMRLFRLGELVPPDPAPPGRYRLAGEADRDLLGAWHEAFARDVGGPDHNQSARIDDRLRYGGLVLWEVGGVPVSMAGRTPVVSGMSRVAPVYTPPAHRGRGYGSAVTVAVSRTALEDGAAEVLLFTDLANPTTNSIYPRVGYRPVEDRVDLSFGPAPAR